MGPDGVNPQSDRGFPYNDTDQILAGADTDWSVEGIEIGRGGGVHGDLRDQMSDMEWSPLEDHINTMDTPLQDHFSEASTSRLFRVPDNELPESPVDTESRTAISRLSLANESLLTL
jgi:hypothetical protein